MSKKYHIRYTHHDRDIIREVYHGHTNAITPNFVGYYNYKEELVVEVSTNYSHDIGITVVQKKDGSWERNTQLSTFYPHNENMSISQFVSTVITKWEAMKRIRNV
jgi:hypothetical protein